VRGDDGIYRVFYYTASEQGVLVFHAFVKKTGNSGFEVVTRTCGGTGGVRIQASGARNRLRQQGIWIPPFPFPPAGGKAGAGGFPPRRQKRAAPPTRGAAAPLVHPPGCRSAGCTLKAGVAIQSPWKIESFTGAF
jgi:hypothetical protein